jgi:membrane fusion protein (multidrug efflux system)
LLLVGVIALIAALIWGIYWWVSGRFIESTDDAYLQADSTVVAPKVAGYVAEVYVKSNQSVKKGDPLVRLDNRQYQAQLDQAQATIEARQADLDRATADIKQEQAEIEQAQAQVKLARLNLRHAQEEVDRYVPLDVTGAATSEKLAELRNARDQAQANLEAAQAGLKSAQSRLTANTAQIEQARAQIKAGQASLRQTSIDVGDTIVRAAIDGRVGDDTVRVGQFAQPGTRMMTIVPIQQTYLVANFKETQIGRMRIGQAAEIHIDAMPDLDLHGVIESFSPGTGAQFALLPPENATGNFTKIVQRVPVRIRLQADAQTRERLLPGLSVTVDVDTKHDGTQDQRTTQSPQSNSPQENQRG